MSVHSGLGSTLIVMELIFCSLESLFAGQCCLSNSDIQVRKVASKTKAAKIRFDFITYAGPGCSTNLCLVQIIAIINLKTVFT